MAEPLFSPAKGIGSQVSSGGTIYQFGTSGWSPVASGNFPAKQPVSKGLPTSQQKTTTNTTSQPNQNQPQQAPTFFSGNVPTGPSAEEMAQIEDAYNAGMGYLSNVEGRLRPEYQSALQEAESIYKTQAGVLGGQKQQAQTQLQEQATKGQQAYESALAQARQTYEQLQRGYQQRFGGASSAGQAASEIANVERLRQQGANYRTLQDVNRQVQAGLQSIDQQYNQNLLQLEQNKIAAQNQARRDFNDKLNQIDAQRGALAQNKAAQKLAALQNLRQQILQIEAENRNFQNTLNLYREQVKLQLQANLAKNASSISTVDQAQKELENQLKKPTTNLTPTPTTGQTQTTQNLQGYAQTLKPEDFYRFSLPQIAGRSAQLTA